LKRRFEIHLSSKGLPAGTSGITYNCGKMDDRIGAGKNLPKYGGIPDVALDKGKVIFGKQAKQGVTSIDEGVENTHLIAPRQQKARQYGTNISSATRNEYLHRYIFPVLRSLRARS